MANYMGVNIPDSTPIPAAYPTYVGMDPNQMALAPGFNGPNAPLDRFSQESMRNGPSAGTQFALNQNRIGANNARDQARKMSMGMGKDAQARLSMQGGLGAGSAERIQKNANNQALDFSNAADANASGNRSNLLIADEGARIGNLEAAGKGVQAQNAQRYDMAANDLQRQQNEYNRRNAYNMGIYNTQMSAWGAGNQANATADSSKK